MKRFNNRDPDQLRSCRFQRNFLKNATGSVLVEQGNTRVLCAVSVVPGVPRWMKEQNMPGGWLTCEYQMLPASTAERIQREINRGKPSGRSQEIQRLIGRSLRAMVNLPEIGTNTVYVDCDVIDADGGTRCASINGASVALHLAFQKMINQGSLVEMPTIGHVAAISVGIVNQNVLLDLCYEEDSAAEVDMNVVMTDSGRFVEIQGTGEAETFSQEQMDQMIDLAKKGINKVVLLQRECINS